ncbi:Mbov_0397 family ICE element conjugal transfer ATPase [Mesomycoplasma molare]|uniref:Type IV secretion system DNA-binding domain-containing protein n=1 Tax=Mesomycoplasma molare TaxID=171288 RepID=A0ABY5TUZ5_9BACT|nr:type IV secretion system DNA-binding domain-containing protein [Mesomycoplasma molare]UWD34483.1 type IV secretion system DNA-binding domain-containing protein [Mesomycoplasma molare]
MAKLQSKKLKHSSTIFIWKKFTLIDTALLFVFIFISYGLSFFAFSFAPNLVKFILFISVLALEMTLLIPISSHGAKGYIVFGRMIRFLLRPKKYSMNSKTSAKTKFLVPYEKVENDYIKNKNISYAMRYFGAIEIEGRDISKEHNDDMFILIEKLTLLFSKINTKATIIKLPKLINLNKNIETFNNLKNKNNINISKEMFDYFEKDLNDKNQNRQTDKYFLVIYANDVKSLDEEIKNISDELYNIGLNYEKLKIDSLLNLINEIQFPHTNFSNEELEEIKNAQKIDEFFAFSEIEFKASYIKSKDAFYSTQTISEFPLSLNQSWVQRTFDSDSVVFWHITPLKKEKISKILDNTEKNMEVNYLEEQNRFESRKLQKEYESLNELAEVAAQDQEAIVYSTIILFNRALSLEELKELEKTNKKNLEGWNAKINNLTYRQFEGYSSTLLKWSDNIKEAQEQIASNISFAWPFALSENNDYNHNLVGFSEYDKSPVFFDQSLKNDKRQNFNMFIVGTSGAGKTTFTKKAIVEKLMKNDEIIILDPQGEFTKFTNKMNGEIINLGSSSNKVFNPLQIRKLFNPKNEENTKSTNSELFILHENFLREWLKILYPEFLDSHIRYIIYSLKKLYQKLGFYDMKEDISELANDKYPIFSDLIEFMKEDKSKDFFNNEIKNNVLFILSDDFLENGRFKEIYNNHSNVDINNKMTLFNVSSLMNLSKNIFNASFYLIISFIQGRISNTYNKNYHIWIYIDEAHKFIDEENISTLDFVFSTVKEGRKYNCGTTLTTQNPSDFVKTEKIANKGRAIIGNCQYSAIFKLKSQDIEAINNLYSNLGGLTESEKRFLALALTGKCILTVSETKRLEIDSYYNLLEKEIYFDKGDLRR